MSFGSSSRARFGKTTRLTFARGEVVSVEVSGRSPLAATRNLQPLARPGEQACGAKTRKGPCPAAVVLERSRCLWHGGASTGARTTEGRERLRVLGRARYVSAALDDGWVAVSANVRVVVDGLKLKLGGSQNATAKALGVTRHCIRRVLTSLPLRPEEFHQIMRRLAALGLAQVTQISMKHRKRTA